jgi:tRNA-splicing ligase RtcB
VFDQITRDVPVGREQHREGRELKSALAPLERELRQILSEQPQIERRFPRAGTGPGKWARSAL